MTDPPFEEPQFLLPLPQTRPAPGWADTTFPINRLFAPGQQPARCSIYRAIVIREMSDPWPDLMTKFIISPAKSSTDNRLLSDVIRKGCLAVGWDTVMSHHQDH